MKRTASAEWAGSVKEGKGHITTPGGVLNQTPYNFTSRFESGAGTNPEELIAAAHAGCYSMALSATLGGSGIVPTSIATTASLDLVNEDGKWVIKSVHLTTHAVVPGISAEAFAQAANYAKENCLVSKALSIPVTLTATLG